MLNTDTCNIQPSSTSSAEPASNDGKIGRAVSVYVVAVIVVVVGVVLVAMATAAATVVAILYNRFRNNSERLAEFLPRDATQSAVMRLHVVCLSVCLSVTFRYRDHIGTVTQSLLALEHAVITVYRPILKTNFLL